MAYEEELQKAGLTDEVLAASKKIFVSEDGLSQNFLSLVVVPLLDANRDSVIDKAELLGLQVGRHCP